jgi:hypothetical protein
MGSHKKSSSSKSKSKSSAPSPKSGGKEAPALDPPSSGLKAKKTIAKVSNKSQAAQEMEELAVKRNELLEELKKIDRQVRAAALRGSLPAALAASAALAL